ncbi:MAG: hypothetical protein E6586_02755 [Bifidobacterium scardovii]|nr:hypothetical protein [Bifidobacterium scardovii]MDU3736765.1 hypothetical protein [Bifidobacterium scardovii]MDU5296188.1 hypothetical protein [Bifidobacterium scardovii]MDU5610772.1 hypothetical protein [Bifidobacterium scardovii]MDU5885996.1 hypothetical protein [Bifidobacterium scardovii]MDU6281503.1 hypothetical protein [Bifidobacterium scardovii]
MTSTSVPAIRHYILNGKYRSLRTRDNDTMQFQGVASKSCLHGITLDDDESFTIIHIDPPIDIIRRNMTNSIM